MSLRRSGLSRRRFSEGAVAAGVTAITHRRIGAEIGDASVSIPQSDEPGLTSAQTQEVEARLEEILRRCGDRLSEEQRSRLRAVLVENERLLAAIREFPLANDDAPATTLKLRMEQPASTQRD